MRRAAVVDCTRDHVAWDSRAFLLPGSNRVPPVQTELRDLSHVTGRHHRGGGGGACAR
jgi:hypothetical protein